MATRANCFPVVGRVTAHGAFLMNPAASGPFVGRVTSHGALLMNPAASGDAAYNLPEAL